MERPLRPQRGNPRIERVVQARAHENTAEGPVPKRERPVESYQVVCLGARVRRTGNDPAHKAATTAAEV